MAATRVSPDAPEVEPQPARRPRSSLLLALAGVLVIGFAAFGLGPITDHFAKGDSSPAAAPSANQAAPTTTAAPAVSTTPTTTSFAAELQAEVTALSSFVENTRGLKFKTPITPTLLSNDDFLKDFQGQDKIGDKEKAAIRSEGQVLKALGLLSPDIDLVKLATEGVATDVFGYFDPKTKRLVVRGSEITPLTRMVLVHELTHALDDQQFTLSEPVLESDDGTETGQAYRALVEGDAVRVQEVYRSSLSAADRVAIESEAHGDMAVSGGEDYSDQPASYFVAFPYLDGRAFVEELFKEGGNSLVDAAFSRPPQSTAEILEVDRYAAGIIGASISEPAADGEVVDRGVLGELGLFLVLSEVLPPEEAGAGASTWEGDRSVAWRDGDRMCVRVRFLLEAPWLNDYTSNLLARWAGKQVDATVEAPGTVLLTSCR